MLCFPSGPAILGGRFLELSLEGRVALVTGGSKGIGRAIALAFAEAGASVALAARGEEDLNQTATEIEAVGGRALPVVSDVSDPERVQNLVDRTVERFRTIDILVNNAGAAPFLSTLDQMRPEGFEKYFRINFMSAVYCTKAVGPIMVANGGGCVLNVASVAAFIATPGLTYYGAAKAAIVQFTRTMSREWAASSIRVNALAPGWIETPLNERPRQVPKFNREILAQIPLGRWGTPEEVAAAALFLCSSAASFITGSVLIVDGGQTTSSLAEL